MLVNLLTFVEASFSVDMQLETFLAFALQSAAALWWWLHLCVLIKILIHFIGTCLKYDFFLLLVVMISLACGEYLIIFSFRCCFVCQFSFFKLISQCMEEE